MIPLFSKLAIQKYKKVGFVEQEKYLLQIIYIHTCTVVSLWIIMVYHGRVLAPNLTFISQSSSFSFGRSSFPSALIAPSYNTEVTLVGGIIQMNTVHLS